MDFKDYFFIYEDSQGFWSQTTNPKFIASHTMCRAVLRTESTVIDKLHEMNETSVTIDICNNKHEFNYYLEMNDKDNYSNLLEIIISLGLDIWVDEDEDGLLYNGTYPFLCFYPEESENGEFMQSCGEAGEPLELAEFIEKIKEFGYNSY